MFNYSQVDASALEFVAVAEVKDLPPGERLFVQIDELVIIVFNIAGRLFAIGDVCSHDGNSLDEAPLDGFAVTCQRHGARFDVRSGKVLALPAVADIPAYPVRVTDGQIEVGVPVEG